MCFNIIHTLPNVLPISSHKSLIHIAGQDFVLVCFQIVDSVASPAKKARNELSREMRQLIGEDELNKKIWDELLAGATQESSVSMCVCVCVCVCVHVCAQVLHQYEISSILQPIHLANSI